MHVIPEVRGVQTDQDRGECGWGAMLAAMWKGIPVMAAGGGAGVKTGLTGSMSKAVKPVVKMVKPILSLQPAMVGLPSQTSFMLFSYSF